MLTWLSTLWDRWGPQGVARADSIPEALWADLLQEHPFLGWRPQEDVLKLRSMSAQFLRQKEFQGAHGFVVTDPIALAVAAQACLPVLHLGLRVYQGFVGIVMHEGPVRARREATDEFGLVHTWEEELVGEAMGDGPVMLSWHEGVHPCGPREGRAFNVVVHEFVHILDGLDGHWDGTPALGQAHRDEWQGTLQAAFDRFDERSACGYASVMDDYGAQDLVEFFAVSSEAFFTQPRAFREEQPEVYSLYSRFYRQDPALYQPEATQPA